MRDVGVHDSPRGNIPHSTDAVIRIFREQPRVVSLLDDQEGDTGLVSVLQRPAGALDGADLAVQDFVELALANTVAEVDDSLRFAAKKKVCDVRKKLDKMK